MAFILAKKKIKIMKKILLSIITLTAFGIEMNAQITDLPISANPTTVCNGASAVVSTTGSQTGVSYVLRNSTNTAVDGPIEGTGTNLDFSAGAITSAETFNVYATKATGANLLFDGVDDYVTLGTNVRGISFVETVACWIRSSASGSNQYIMTKYNLSNGIQLYFDSNGKMLFDGKSLNGSSGSSGPSTTSVNDGVWHYVAGVVNDQGGSKIWKIYVDGILENSGTSTMGAGNVTNSTPLHIGKYSGSYFTGEIDEVQIWNTELSASTILNNKNNCLLGSEANLFGFFKFGEGAGTDVTDLSNFGGHGVLMNMSSTSWVNNSISPCNEESNLIFDGVNDYVNLGASTRGVSNIVTVGCWIKSSTTGLNQYIYTKYDGGYSGVLLYFNASGKILFDGRAASGSYGTSGPSSTSVNDGAWHYVVGVVNNQGSSKIWKIYVDGILESSGTSNFGAGNVSNSIAGLIGGYSGSYFTGEIDDVQIWDSELSASTILSNMNSCLSGTESNLVGLFKFDEGSGANATDYSVSVLNGSLVSMNAATSWINNRTSACYNVNYLQMTQTVTINSNPVINVSTSLTGSTITANLTGATYRWLDCNNNNTVIPNETGIGYTASANGNYAIEITVNGCVDTSACTSITTIGINEIKNKEISLYPNPTTSQLTINTTEQIKSINILDVSGKTVKAITPNNNTIDVSDLTNGIYFLKIETENGIVTSKFIKE